MKKLNTRSKAFKEKTEKDLINWLREWDADNNFNTEKELLEGFRKAFLELEEDANGEINIPYQDAFADASLNLGIGSIWTKDEADYVGKLFGESSEEAWEWAEKRGISEVEKKYRYWQFKAFERLLEKNGLRSIYER